LLRWYPAAWRGRYGDEFTELLIAEFAERPRSWRRAADVARGGLLARLTRAGLSGRPPESPEQIRVGLATAACSAGAFLAFGIAMWAQLTIGWEWEPPRTAATTIAMTAMTAAVLLLAGDRRGLGARAPARGRHRRGRPGHHDGGAVRGLAGRRPGQEVRAGLAAALTEHRDSDAPDGHPGETMPYG